VAIQFWNGKVLFVNGQIAMDPRCCCKKAGCQCPSNLPDVLKIRFPYVSYPGDPNGDKTEWVITVRRPIPQFRDPPYDYERLYVPPHVGNCCWYGETDAGWDYIYEGVNYGKLGSCGPAYLWLDPDGCVWRMDSQWGALAYGTRSGNTPVGTYLEYALDWRRNVEVTE
jgi:hypothetical protein